MKQIIKNINSPINARIEIPGSKSITNRALLLAALADGVSEISNILISDDTRAFANALHELGIMIQLDESTRTCILGGGTGEFPKKEASIECAQAGTVARFLLAACAVSRGIYHFNADEQLCNRPINGLLKILRAQGIKIIPDTATKLPLTIEVTETLLGGEMEVDGSETGQFVSALLMAAPFARTAVSMVAHNMVSRSYVEMTCAMMAEFGVLVRRIHQSHFVVPVPQQYMARDYIVEPDLTTASYFFAAAAITGGNVTIQSVDRKQSKQGDVVFLSILEKMGCNVFEGASELTVVGPVELHGINVDMRDYSDTFMTLAAIAPFATTPTTITNIGHTRLQESDRIRVMHTELEKLGVKVDEGHDWLRIHPSVPHGGTINAHYDHRIAMAFAILGLRVPGIEIDGAECVSKTCPEFFELLKELYTQ